MSLRALSGERSFTVVAAAFDDLRTARQVATMLEAGGEVAVVRPGDRIVDCTMESDPRGIWLTLIRSHVTLGLAGLAVGVLVALALVVDGSPAAVSSPTLLALLGGAMGASGGLLAAGLWTLRPDHGAVIARVRERLDSGQFAVVVRPASEVFAKSACAALRRAGGTTFRSL